ncbi:aminotransferase class I/II-fold pyridoxal phosphate-dependent enzyme [Emticicia sp. BO119]|uniref:aminotransferase class I/II-fold pyridoxal phosphate-dependent enzyme n=1 Tax=Emticicia sp. BO119 TaxID=2757768 RepID=UPI0015F0E1E4|nr:aminotransferase class I/II-fold pyridoxal phosphate-dependent enzyme [Emticicia sp. BO119]MBA4851677.1 pyridoxal phosphate-dependent aminotransferase family protein [Emticicia sp. BO119]
MHKDFIIHQQPSNKIRLEEKEYHFFSGTSYLGMNQDQEFKQLLIEGLYEYGMSFGSSRNGNLQLAIYETAENKMAAWVGAEKALTVSSGMLAGQLVAQYFKTQQATFFYAPQSHSANFHEPIVQLPAMRFQEWAKQIAGQIKEANAQHSVIVCNSTDGLRATAYEFDWINDLPEDRAITLIIDDSHGLGITGQNGAGIFQSVFVKPNIRFVVVSSLHKAMGIPGGVVLGDEIIIEALRHTAFFASCSPIAPAYLYAYVKGDEIYQRNFERLLSNVERFSKQLQSVKDVFNSQPAYPVFYTPQDSLYDYLFKEEIFIYSFAYPIKTGKPNTRIVISAWHDIEQIDLLAAKCNEFAEKYI